MKKTTKSKNRLFSKGKDSSCKDAGVIYGLGVVGAAIYFIQTATSFWGGVWGLVKAFLWPAFLVYDLMKFLGM